MEKKKGGVVEPKAMHVLNIFLICVIGLFLGFTTQFCEIGSSPRDEYLAIEMDKMKSCKYMPDIETFEPEFKAAKEKGTIEVKEHEEDIEDQPILDEQQLEVTIFIETYQSFRYPNHKGECYLAGVLRVFDSEGVEATGLAIYDGDPEVEREAAAVLAYKTLLITYENTHPDPPDAFGCYWAQVTAHELGHCFNMDHCNSAGCIMKGKVETAVEAHDIFCSSCDEYLKKYWP